MQTESPPTPPTPALSPEVGDAGEPCQPHITAADHERHEARVAARVRANADPLPGPLLAAFAAEPITVAGITLVQITASHIALLRRIDSPLHAMLSGQLEELDEEQTIEALYTLSRGPREGRATLARGRETFRETALQTVGDALRVGDLAAIGAALLAQVTQSFSTALSHAARPSEDGSQSFTAHQPAVPTTDSAGGSPSSPSSPAITAGRSPT